MRQQLSKPSLILVVALSLVALTMPTAVAACSCALITTDHARTLGMVVGALATRRRLSGRDP